MALYCLLLTDRVTKSFFIKSAKNETDVLSIKTDTATTRIYMSC